MAVAVVDAAAANYLRALSANFGRDESATLPPTERRTEGRREGNEMTGWGEKRILSLDWAGVGEEGCTAEFPSAILK